VPEAHVTLREAADFPLPAPVVEHAEAVPVRRVQAAIPDSMKTSPPIAPPVLVTVNAAQMMAVPVPQPAQTPQQFSEPVPLSEEAARALVIHSVNPTYPAAGLAQKLHGPVVLQAVVGRDGSVEDLKIVRGNFVLAQAAIAAVKQWRFQPYTQGGHAASTQTVITLNFSYPPG
jgi:TonB family protein